MKNQDITQNLSVDFWKWFKSEEAGIQSLLDGIPGPITPYDISSRIKNIQKELGWELGPGVIKPFQFVVSPGGIRNLIPLADFIISIAPNLDSWELHSCKPPKPNPFQLSLKNKKGQVVNLDASTWEYSLTAFKNENAFDILLIASELPDMDASSRKYAAYIVLDSIFGERMSMDIFMKVDLIRQIDVDPILANRMTSIKLLNRHVMELMG